MITKEQIRDHYDKLAPQMDGWLAKSAYFHKQIDSQLRFVVRPGSRVLDLGCGAGDTLAAMRPSRGVGVDISPEMIEHARARHPELEFQAGDVENLQIEGRFDYIILSMVVGELADVQACLEGLKRFCTPQTRILIFYYSRLWEKPLTWAEKLGWKTPSLQQNWLPPDEVVNLLELAGYQMVRVSRHVLIPKETPLLSNLINRFLGWLPLIKHLCFTHLVVARPLGMRETDQNPSVSIVLPCRNERDNLSQALKRLPLMGEFTELIFVEGGSTDGTAEEAQRLVNEYEGPVRLQFMRQDGKGKGDAVRKGYAHAKGDILMILDADLTVPPEDLPKFYNAMLDEHGEFINGCRLVYPMEAQAMRFLNMLGNKFFGWGFSVLLHQRLRDTLCGTKVLRRDDYERLAEDRAYFGHDDPFGDFDLCSGRPSWG